MFGYTDPEPTREVRPNGQGLPDADYVLYVRSSATGVCVQQVSHTPHVFLLGERVAAA